MKATAPPFPTAAPLADNETVGATVGIGVGVGVGVSRKLTGRFARSYGRLPLKAASALQCQSCAVFLET